MTLSSQQASDGLLPFCLSFYSAKEVELLCLKLQDDYRANVNIVLWALWLDTYEVALEPQAWQRAARAIRTMDILVKAARGLRRFCPKWRWLKRLRSAMKATELALEYRVIAILHELSQVQVATERESQSSHLHDYLSHLGALNFEAPIKNCLAIWQ